MNTELLLIGKYILAEVVALILYTLSGMAKASKTETFDIEALKDGCVKNLYCLGCYVCLLIIGILLPSQAFEIPGYESLGSFTAFGIVMWICNIDLICLTGKAIINLIIAKGLVDYLKKKIDSKEDTTEVEEETITEVIEEDEEDGGLG